MKSKVKPANTGKLKAKAAAASAPHDDLKNRRLAKVAAKKVLTQSATPPANQANGHAQAAAAATAAWEKASAGRAASSEPETEPVPPAEFITVPGPWLAAALTIAPVKDVRGTLNGVRIQQTAGGATRVVSTDGKRLFVAELEGLDAVSWGQAGITLPAIALARVAKFVGKGEYRIGYGPGLPTATIEDVPATASFKVTPIEGNFPDYQRVLDAGAAVFTAEKTELESSQIDAAFLKSASIVAAQIGSIGITPHIGDADAPVVFTFNKAPQALLYIMPMRSDHVALDAPTVKMFGRDAILATIAKLKAAEKISRENATRTKIEKFRDQSLAKADRLAERAAALQAIIAVKIEGPKPAASAAVTPKIAVEAPASVN